MGQSGGRNPHLHHQHHGSLTLVSGRDVGGVGVGADSCLLLNDQLTGYSILHTHIINTHTNITAV